MSVSVLIPTSFPSFDVLSKPSCIGAFQVSIACSAFLAELCHIPDPHVLWQDALVNISFEACADQISFGQALTVGVVHEEGTFVVVLAEIRRLSSTCIALLFLPC